MDLSLDLRALVQLTRNAGRALSTLCMRAAAAFTQIYYVYDQPMESYRVTVIDWLKDDFPTIDNHCIIISKTPTNLFDLIVASKAS